MSDDGPRLLVIERVLRDREGIWQQIVEERELNRLTVSMLASSAIALACYGAVLGAFHSFLMALTSAVKLPLLFLITLAICLPTLYLFNLVFGAKLSVRQALALVMTAITVTSMLAVGFAPISLFFLITAPDYGFFKLLNVGILGLSALVGLRFLIGGMEALNDKGLESAGGAAPVGGAVPAGAVPAGAAPAGAVPAGAAPVTDGAGTVGEPVAVPVGAPNGASGDAAAAPATRVVTPGPGHARPAVGFPGLTHPYVAPVRRGYADTGRRPASMTLLYIWILLFGFVGTQLGWTLRPFFGNPQSEGFALFRSIEGNFYAEIFRTIANLG